MRRARPQENKELQRFETARSTSCYFQRVRRISNCFFRSLKADCRLANRFHIKNRSRHSKSYCAEKIHSGTQFPQIGAQDRPAADDQIPDKVVGADHLRASFRFRVSNDQSLTRLISELFNNPTQKLDYKLRKIT